MTYLTEDVKEYVYKTQQHLHTIPEPAFHEIKTASYIANELEDMGYTVKTGLANTGLTAYKVGKQKHPCVAIRADMDCIIHENNGKVFYRHSCGHDAHSSIALGVAKALADKIDDMNGSIKFIFQPAEETGEGAKAMVEAGVLSNVDYLIGYHLRMDAECLFGKMSPSLYHSAGCTITGEVQGQTAHGGRPHLGTNAIDILHSLITNINTIRSNPLSATNIKFTKLSAGGGSLNVIPGKGSFGIDVRSASNEELEASKEKIRRIFDQTAQMYQAKISYEMSEGVPAPRYDERLEKIAEKAISKVLGADNLEGAIYTPGGEDFHYYTKLTDVKAVYMAIGAEVSPGLHDPNMTFNKEAMVNGAKVVCEMVRELLGNEG
ncbi:amidohydrolase [Bacillus timonensis]|nr:amidohydrolase [Bacillus timonensis]